LEWILVLNVHHDPFHLWEVEHPQCVVVLLLVEDVSDTRIQDRNDGGTNKEHTKFVLVEAVLGISHQA
jgi:hypothetical protein